MHTARPQRSHVELHDELHARPALPVHTPGVVSYWTQWQLNASVAEAALAALCASVGAPAPPAGVRHHVLHASGFDLKFERHGEFVSWLASVPLAQQRDAPLDPLLLECSASAALPAAFHAALAATPMLGAAHVLRLRADERTTLDACRAVFARAAAASDAPLLGARIGDGDATVLTDLRLQADGHVRFVVLDHGQGSEQAARTAQRLCEIEAYRMLAMLGFPLAQAESAALAGIEQRLQATVDAMANDDRHDDAAAFDTLTTLAAEVEHGAARTRYRFSATRAYQRLVEQRLADLREQRVEGLQTLTGFFARRFAPAMGLCASTDARLTDIAERINRAVDLARVRVEMQREAGNQALLAALAHRQKLQLRLQQTVEGLSVVAISYYAVGLVGYAAKALKDQLPITPEVLTGLAVLPVLLVVALFVRRLRRHFEAAD
jgi:uncharacterized membrane-anchored protein